eukprot:gene11479-12844_t
MRSYYYYLTLALYLSMSWFFLFSQAKKVQHGSLSPAIRAAVRKAHPIPSHHLHRVIFAIKQQNIESLKTLLHEVSDINHPNYGRHLSRQAVGEFTQNPLATSVLLDYLDRFNCQITHRSLYDEYIEVEASISVWEEVFDTRFHAYLPAHHTGGESGHVVIGADDYSLAEELLDHVEAVFNIVEVIPPVSSGVAKKVLSSQSNGSRQPKTLSASIATDGYVRPSLLSTYYAISSNTGNSLTSQALYASSGQTLSLSDLSQFQSSFSLPSQNISAIIGGHVSDSVCVSTPDDCDESNLDVQYIMAVAQQVPTTYYYTTLSWAKFLLQVASMSNPPDVISMSYSSDEAFISTSTKSNFETEAIKLGTMGVTLVAASGDDGIAGYWYRSGYYSTCGYHPQFPASCPYVVAVGGTQGPESGSAEVTCSSRTGAAITSGGGFSTLYDAPSYQTSLLSAYLASTNPASGYNAKGRGYPDVSLMASDYLVVIGGNTYAVSGTSASTPAFAGMLSLINSARKAAGYSSLGWVNPLLYANYSSFAKDITDGDNYCTAISTMCCSFGFNASAGWDAATGLGSVNYTGLLAVAMHAAIQNGGKAPTSTPTLIPTAIPSIYPTTPSALLPPPTSTPTVDPSTPPPVVTPSLYPTTAPNVTPSIQPTIPPVITPTHYPSIAPTITPSRLPTTATHVTHSLLPSTPPTITPSRLPTTATHVTPSLLPSTPPVVTPSVFPSTPPVATPSIFPSTPPVLTPSLFPSTPPVVTPSVFPSTPPAATPSIFPSTPPVATPSIFPSTPPVVTPSVFPSTPPVATPSIFPSTAPVVTPTLFPTRVPTVLLPSRFPTASKSSSLFPSVVPTAKISFVLTFSSYLSLSGLSTLTLSSSDQLAITETYATAMQVSSSYISYIGIEQQPSSSVQQGSLRVSSSASRIASVGAKIELAVALPLDDFPQYASNSTALYTNVKGSLTTFVSSGSMSNTLESKARENGSNSSLVSASVVGVEVTSASVEQLSPTPSPTKQPNSSNSGDGLTKAEMLIVIIVPLGGVFLISVAVALGMYWMKRQRQDDLSFVYGIDTSFSFE